MDELKKQMRAAFDLAMRNTGYSAEVKDIHAALDANTEHAVTFGRVSVLRDFDNLCAADAIMGFTEPEFAAVKKFLYWNKEISGWDKPEEV